MCLPLMFSQTCILFLLQFLNVSYFKKRGRPVNPRCVKIQAWWSLHKIQPKHLDDIFLSNFYSFNFELRQFKSFHFEPFFLFCFDCVVTYFLLNKNYWKYVYFFICHYFCVQNAYAISVDIFWRLISCQDNWEMFNLLSIFISYVLLGNTVFVKTFLWSEFWKICLHG